MHERAHRRSLLLDLLVKVELREHLEDLRLRKCRQTTLQHQRHPRILPTFSRPLPRTPPGNRIKEEWEDED